jgi:hypothetical protein
VSGATLVRRDISSTIYLPGFRLPGKRLRGAGKAERSGIAVRTSHDFPVFIMLLNERLQDKYGRQAVHTAEEIGMLAGRFPDNIRLYGAYLDGTMIAGAILYISGQTVHLQYSGTSEAGRSLRALDALITHIITAEYGNHRWFDFGISTEQDGRYLNEGLMRQKEEFGASAVCYDTYSLEMAV